MQQNLTDIKIPYKTKEIYMVIPYARTTITNQFLMHNCKERSEEHTS